MVTAREQRRVTFEDLDVKQLPDGRCAGRAVLAWVPGDDFVGTAEGPDSPTGQLRCAAEATARALELAVYNKIKLEVLGVKGIEAFDAILVVVSLSSRLHDEGRRLVGSCLTEGNASRGAALAVLSATNRLMSVYLREV